MKSLILILLTFSFAAQAELTLFRAPLYIKLKPAFKHLRMIPRPVRISKRQILLDSSFDIKLKDFGMSKSVVDELASIVVLCSKNGNNPALIKRSWQQFVGKLKKESAPIDINLLIQYVLRKAYLQNNQDLQFYADKVRHFNNTKKSIRGYLKNLNKQKLTCRARGQRCSRTTVRDIDVEIRKWEDELSSIGDDSQLANIDLQNALQKQQKTLQTLSNVSKMLHDVAMAIIRKIG